MTLRRNEPLTLLVIAAHVSAACGGGPQQDAEVHDFASAPPPQGPQMVPPSEIIGQAGLCTELPPLLDRTRTRPAVDPTTCVDQTPKVGFVTVSRLPSPIRQQLLASITPQVSGAPVSPPFYAADRLLLYVPPAGEDGVRRVTLEGDPSCDPDACLSEVTCGRPTEEKCAAPSPTTCVSRLTLPGLGNIPLSARQLGAQTDDDPPLELESFRGVIIAAGEITISGHVRTNGNDLVLLTDKLIAGTGAIVDVTPLRRPVAEGPIPGARLLVYADDLQAPGLELRADGARGGLPRTAAGNVAFHGDCRDQSPDQWGNPRCFPCDYWGSNDACSTNDRRYRIRTVEEGKLRCVTHAETSLGRGAQTITYFADYPPPPNGLPQSFRTTPPAGGDGGEAGRIDLYWRTGSSPGAMLRRSGQGALGLEGYHVLHMSSYGCPLGTDQCVVDTTGARWKVRPGANGATPRSPRAVLSSRANIGSRAEAARVIAHVADELVVQDQVLFTAEQAYRAGDLGTAEARYELALELLGDAGDLPCTIAGRHLAAQREANGRLAQLRAGLDFMGRAPDWAPYTPPQVLSSILESKLIHAAFVATDVKLNALLSITSADQQAQIGSYLQAADGELAALEQEALDATMLEKQTRVEEMAVYAGNAQSHFAHLTSQLEAYYQAMSNPPSGAFEMIAGIGAAAGDFIGKLVGIISDGLSFGGVFGAIGSAVSLGTKIATAADTLSAEWTCETDPTCIDLKHQLEQSRIDLYAVRLGLQAALYAVQAEEAAQALFDGRRRASEDVALVLQQNGYHVASFDRLALAGRTLCRYGRLLVDDAAADLFAYKRSFALWDVPPPAADASVYDGGGAHYDYDFNAFIDPACQSTDCTLWGEYDTFNTARLAHVVPNASDLYLGSGDELAAALAASAAVQPPGPARRAELALGIFESGSGSFLGARHTASSVALGATPFSIANGVDLSARAAIQVHGIEVWGTALGQPLRPDFPFRVTRPSSEVYRNGATTELAADVAIPAGRALDGGALVDELALDPATSRFVHSTCCDLTANPIARPESLRKPWVVWVPICTAPQTPGPACASEAELQALDTLSIAVSTRYKAL